MNMVKVLKKKEIAEKVYILEFDKKITYTPGQIITIKIKDLEKHFSIISKSGENVQIATLDTGSDFKKSLLDSSEVELSEPMSDFNIEKTGKRAFIAGGIGITPFISALRNFNDDVKLIYSVGSLESAGFLDELKEFENLDLFIRVTSEEGRIDSEFLKECLDLDEEVYIIGGGKFVEEMVKLLESLGVKKIRKETFPGY